VREDEVPYVDAADVADPDYTPLSAFLSCRPQQARFQALFLKMADRSVYQVQEKDCVFIIFGK